MNLHSDKSEEEILRERIIGLGTRSHQKSYYPELKRRIGELERFRTLLNETGDAIFLVNASTYVCIDVNHSASTLTAYSSEKLLSIRFDKIVDPHYLSIIQHFFSDAEDAERTLRTEMEIISADSKIIPVEITIKKVTLTDQAYFVIIARDITERKKIETELQRYRSHLEEMVAERNEELTTANQDLIHEVKIRIEAEEHLEEEKERLEVTLRSIGDAVITTDIKGTITYLNKAAQRMINPGTENSHLRPISEFVQIYHNNAIQNIHELILRAVGTGKTVSLDEVSVIFIRGPSRIISVIISPIIQSSKISGVVMVLRDITERVRLSEEIQKHERLESLGVLAGGIAHDFNNILTAILGNISLSLELIGENNIVTDRIREAEKATFRAKSLTQQLLTFSKGGAPVRECARVEDLITETTGFAISGSNMRVVYDFPDTLHPVEIDRGQISQVIQNLVINAQQAMPEGGTLVIQAVNTVLMDGQVVELKPGRYIKISFTDEGHGIEKNSLPHIFEPYFTTKETGSGLGLTSSMFIMKKHHGKIDVSSEQGIGTTFTLWLPICEENVVIRSETVKETEKQHSGTILLMDDEEGILNVVSTLLKRAGWEVTCAHNGEEAVEAYQIAVTQGHPFDAVIMDLIIPGAMGGKEAISEIKKIDPEVYAIVSSGYSNDPIMSEPERFGFSRVLPKPYKVKDLLSLLNRG